MPLGNLSRDHVQHCYIMFNKAVGDAAWQTMAEVAVREMLKEIAAKTFASRGHCKLSASDLMDDGSCIQLTINIDPSEVCMINLMFYFLFYFDPYWCSSVVGFRGYLLFSLVK